MSSGFYLFLPTFKKQDLNLSLVSGKRDCGGRGGPSCPREGNLPFGFVVLPVGLAEGNAGGSPL